MFKAIGRYFRAIGYLFTGRIDEARKALSHNPAVVKATFDRIIDEKKKRIKQYKDAVGAMIAQEEKKKDDLRRLTSEVQRLQQLQEGAAAMARRIVERHNGDVEAVKSDPDYVKCQAAYKDFSSSLGEKDSRIADLESDVQTLEDSIGNHKTQLESLMRDLDVIQQEKHETVADMITAREEEEISDMLSGISRDRTAEELQEMRDMRRQAKARARTSREMAGVDSQRSEAEFLEYATHAAADNEFDALIGLTQAEENREEPPESESEATKIPEG